MKHSLRLRLTLACLALLAIGLIGSGVVTYRLVDSFLVQRIDQQLARSSVGCGERERATLRAGQRTPSGLPAQLRPAIPA